MLEGFEIHGFSAMVMGIGYVGLGFLIMTCNAPRLQEKLEFKDKLVWKEELKRGSL